MTEYALYKGDNMLAMGTISEIAKKMNIEPDSVKFYQYNCHKKRSGKNTRVLIKLDDDLE